MKAYEVFQYGVYVGVIELTPADVKKTEAAGFILKAVR